MAGVNVTITGVIVDLYGRIISGPCKLIGEAVYTDLGVGGGPIVPPPEGEKPPDKPPGIWGGGNEPFPTPPIYLPPQLPPGLRPPEPPQPGDPTTPVPPPAGSPGWPVQPMVPPPYIVVTYPGIGPVYVAPPLTPTPAPSR